MVNGIIHRNEMEGSDMKVSKKIVRMGKDLGKKTFHLFGVDIRG
jgi:hypothetical protein